MIQLFIKHDLEEKVAQKELLSNLQNKKDNKSSGSLKLPLQTSVNKYHTE